MKPHKVQIIDNIGFMVSEIVMAATPKAALIFLLESLPDDHRLWQSPGWRDVQAFESRDAFFIKQKGGVS